MNHEPTLNLQALWDAGKIKRGDKFVVRAGEVFSFVGRAMKIKKYPFVFEHEEWYSTYTENGRYDVDEESRMDIIQEANQ